MQIYWKKKEVFTYEKISTSIGLVWHTNMPTVSLFWNTNMAALFDGVTSCENALLTANDNDSVHRK